MLGCDSTSLIEHVSPGVVLKRPIVFIGQTEVDPRIANCFQVEPRVLARLGHHPRIVRFLGLREDGILLSQASHGNLQSYLDGHPFTSLRQRIAWCVQVAEAVDHIHGHGVVHSDLRPGSILVHETAPGVLDLKLCDFGGSVCEELGLDGLALPDGPFYHPAFGDQSGPMLDIFGMGSAFYVILTGRWPYKSTQGTFEKVDERIEWEEREVYPKFREEKFPDVEGLLVGDVIVKCWMRQFASARDVLDALGKVLGGSFERDGIQMYSSTVCNGL
ncbi:protein kinase-like domain protein [Colletotrichum musicola]|uniref:Protein kinase-like domain protein n=1 Tax=Colletotrichum musicola TaxID=2175873 RepID=A0A8H6JZU5_9PEZI|nr:protein kinase-like domain protein [Colletotrichum musicola]